MDGHRGWPGTGISREFPKRSRRAWNLQNYTPEDGAFRLIRPALLFAVETAFFPLSFSLSSHRTRDTRDTLPSRRETDEPRGETFGCCPGRQVQQSVRFPSSFYPKAIAPLLSFSFVERGVFEGEGRRDIARGQSYFQLPRDVPLLRWNIKFTRAGDAAKRARAILRSWRRWRRGRKRYEPRNGSKVYGRINNLY